MPDQPDPLGDPLGDFAFVTSPKGAPKDWRRQVKASEAGKFWGPAALGALVMFLLWEIPALGGKAGDTLSEWAWAKAPPFGLWWWVFIPPLTGLCMWLPPHLAVRWDSTGIWLAGLVVVAYVFWLAVYLISKG